MGASRTRIAIMTAISLGIASVHAAATAQAPGRTISPGWFAGLWSDNPNCGDAVEFFSDGRYRTPNGAIARWRIERGNVIVLEGDAGQREMAIERISDTQIRTIDGRVNSYRCFGGPVTPDWLVGTWSDPRDCSAPFYVMRDGQFRAPNGALGRWALQGDVLTLTFGQNRQNTRVVRINDNELRLAETGVSSYRCP